MDGSRNASKKTNLSDPGPNLLSSLISILILIKNGKISIAKSGATREKGPINSEKMDFRKSANTIPPTIFFQTVMNIK